MYGNSGLQNVDLRLQMMGRNMLEGSRLISEVVEDDGRQQKWRECDERQPEAAEVAEVIGMCTRVAEDCCVLKCVFGRWNGYLQIILPLTELQTVPGHAGLQSQGVLGSSRRSLIRQRW